MEKTTKTPKPKKVTFAEFFINPKNIVGMLLAAVAISAILFGISSTRVATFWD